MSQRYIWVDYAKAIGIILVVYGHVARGLYNGDIYIPEALYQLADSIIYSFHMPLFFFLSGIFFYQSFEKRGPVKLSFNKIDTIVYPYLVWSIIQGLIEVQLSKYTNGSVAYSDVFVLLTSPRAHFWFLYALFIVFISSAIMFFIFPKKYLVVVLIFSCLLYLYKHLLPDNIIFRLLSRHFVYFVAGVAFFVYQASPTFSSFRSLLCLFVVFVLVQVMLNFFVQDELATIYAVKLSVALVSIAFIVSLSMYLAKKDRPLLALIGSASMAIYLMHILVGSGFRIFLKKSLGIDSYIVHLLLGSFVGVFIPLMAFIVINKFRIPFVFSMPISSYFGGLYKTLFSKK